MPERLVEKIGPANLADVLVHEVAHVARCDQIVVLVQNLVAALYWPHPLIKRLNRELARAREEVCDNFVLAATEAPTYSRTLLSLAQLIQQFEARPGSVGCLTDRWKLEDRIAGLLDNQRIRTTFLNRRGGIFVVATSAALAVLMYVGTITLAAAQINDSDDVEKVANAPSYSGRVETPQGEPIAGAKIWLAVTSHEFNSEANIENREGLLRELGTADEQGRFEVVLDATTTQEIRKRLLFAQTQLVATAEGRGLDWMRLDVFEDNPTPSEQRDTLQERIDKALGDGRFASRALKLRPESQSVRGRLVDLEGHRLPNVKVLAESLSQPDIPRLLKAFEMSWKREFNEAFNASSVGELARSELQKLIPPVTTDENGEFELRGIGDDQLVTLVFDADRIEARPVSVLGREMETVSLPHIEYYLGGAKDVFVGRDFTYAVGPSVPVEGVVTDDATGQPVANVLVDVERLFKKEGVEDSQLRLDTHHMRAVTDGQGRFRITGMPPGQGHVVEFIPPKSEPYLPASQDVSLSLEDGVAKRIEIQVKRGIWIEGRVTDKQSGEPLIATVDYLALRKNPHALDKLGLDQAWVEQRYGTDSDGRYRVLGLPGPGVLLVKSQVPVYPQAAVVDEMSNQISAFHGCIRTSSKSWPAARRASSRFISNASESVSRRGAHFDHVVGVFNIPCVIHVASVLIGIQSSMLTSPGMSETRIPPLCDMHAIANSAEIRDPQKCARRRCLC